MHKKMARDDASLSEERVLGPGQAAERVFARLHVSEFIAFFIQWCRSLYYVSNLIKERSPEGGGAEQHS